MKDSTFDLSTYKYRLVKYWIKLEQYGKDKFLNSSFEEDLEPDGRRRNKVINTLIKSGYLNVVDGRTQITSKAYNECQEKKPNFIERLQESLSNNLMDISGFRWNDLAQTEQKYIINHLSEYEFYYYYEVSKGLCKGREEVSTTFGAPVAESIAYYADLMVRDVDFLQNKKNLQSKLLFEKARKENLMWGLIKLGIFTEEQKEILEKSSEAQLTAHGFKNDPNSWNKDLENQIDKIGQSINRQTKVLEVLNRLDEKMYEYGGWDKFLSDYDNLLIAEVKISSGTL